MGCDGGTIPKRCELVPEKKKKAKKDKNMSRLARWSTCALSNRKLSAPIVSCRLGRLYNKDAVIEHILSSKMKKEFSHIRKMKHVRELNLKPNPFYKDSYLTDVELRTTAQFICPLTNLEMNGCYEFVYFWGCGCVVSKRAFCEIKESSCIVCGKPFKNEDVISINPVEEETDSDSKPATQKFLSKGVKKSTLKSKSKTNQTQNINVEINIHSDTTTSIQPISVSHESTSTQKLPIDPKDSSVYKSLFTSSETFRTKSKDLKPHWVSTFNYSV